MVLALDHLKDVMAVLGLPNTVITTDAPNHPNMAVATTAAPSLLAVTTIAAPSLLITIVSTPMDLPHPLMMRDESTMSKKMIL